MKKVVKFIKNNSAIIIAIVVVFGLYLLDRAFAGEDANFIDNIGTALTDFADGLIVKIKQVSLPWAK